MRGRCSSTRSVSSRYWAPGQVSTGDRAIAPDLLGFACSPKLIRVSYNVACHLEALEPVVPAGSIVVGHSTGPEVVVVSGDHHLAIHRPEVVVGQLDRLRDPNLARIPAREPTPHGAAGDPGLTGPRDQGEPAIGPHGGLGAGARHLAPTKF